MEKLINVKEKGIEIEKRKADALEWIASAKHFLVIARWDNNPQMFHTQNTNYISIYKLPKPGFQNTKLYVHNYPA